MLWNSMLIAFAMYSKIPVPQAEWNEKNMRYAIGFFPLIGVVLGGMNGLYFYWYKMVYGSENMLFSLIPVIVSLLVTGGIHLDGFLDTVDAKSSFGSREKKLEIMKDPNTGAFAVIYGIAYFLILWAAWGSLSLQGGLTVCGGYVVSRCLSGIAVTCFPCAKDSGLARTFQDGAQRRGCFFMLLAEFFLVSMAMVLWFGIGGAAAVGISLLLFLYYYRMSKKEFGGITGDLAGWFLCMTELGIPLVLVFMESFVCL